MTNRPQILLFRGRGIISRCIRWQTRGQYSHAAILRPDGQVIEAWQGSGVRLTRLDDWTDVDRFDVVGMTDAQWEDALAFIHAQIGRGYDYWAVIRFVSRRLMPENDRWFCSEIVFAALANAGVRLLHRVTPSEVSPNMLSFSPLLVPYDQGRTA